MTSKCHQSNYLNEFYTHLFSYAAVLREYNRDSFLKKEFALKRDIITVNFKSEKEKLFQWMEKYAIPDSSLMIVTALLVGAMAGFGAIGFRLLIEFFQKMSFQGIASFFTQVSPFHLMIIPALGGAIIGPMIYRFAREAKGHGVPEVMEAVALHGGRIRPQVALVKILSSAICIGTGGSVGQEGPIAQIGASIGSSIGQVFRLSDERIRNLVACGAAGGISATFNAPIGGALFAMEVVLGRLQVSNFVAVVISAVTADVIGRHFEGNVSTFNVPAYSMGQPKELFLYALLGIVIAVGSVFFTRFLYWMEDLWDKISIPEYIKPIIGGLILGAIGIVTFQSDGIPRIFGVGYGSIGEALSGSLPLKIAIGLFFLKILGTSITIGSGGSGGVFAPSLYAGAMLGLAFGLIAQAIFPSVVTNPGAFSLVGMAAFLGGATHAPITAILILFEMTNDYHIILPLMLTTVVSTLFARSIFRESIYTMKLVRKGIHLDQGQDLDVMQGIAIHEVMSTDYQVITPEMTLKEFAKILTTSHLNAFPVADSKGILRGVLTASDLYREAPHGKYEQKTVNSISTKSNLQIALPNEPVWKSLKRMSALDISLIPVVDDLESRKLIGVVTRANIIRAYNHAIAKRAHLQHQNEMFKLGKLDTTGIGYVEMRPESPYIGEQIRDIPLPDDCLVISVRRKGRKNLSIAHGHTIIQAGDILTVFAEQSCLSEIEHILHNTANTQKDKSSQTKREEFVVPAGAAVIGKRIDQLALPPNLILVNIHRGKEVLIPHGNSVILAGDIIEVFSKQNDIETARDLFTI